jgi:hypothetical protein
MTFQENSDYGVYLDRNNSATGDLKVLVYDTMNSNYQHWRIDTKIRQIISNKSRFKLPNKDFSRLELFGDTIFGLSTSPGTVHRFDLTARKFLGKIDIYGLPPTVHFGMTANYQKVANFNMLRIS